MEGECDFARARHNPTGTRRPPCLQLGKTRGRALRVGVVAHEHDTAHGTRSRQRGQNVRNLPRLHHDKREVIGVVRYQLANDAHTIGRRAALQDIPDGQAVALKHVRPRSARQQRDVSAA